MKAIAVFGLVLCGISLCLAQADSGLKKTHKAPTFAGAAPVTHGEAAATFARVASTLHDVLHIKVSAMPAKGNAGTPVTKAEVVAEMTRIYKIVEPSFTMTPKQQKVDLPRVKIDKASERGDLIKLIERGFVGNYGPLATGAVNTLDTQQFGDSVGFFLARIAECTHTSSTKWTPYLHLGN